jgi:hypothetical protein
MNRLLRVVVPAIVLVAVGIQFVPVDRTNPPVQAVVAAPPEVYDVLERSCFNCHSNQTEWPWYSYVAPVSWLVVRHVNEARQEMNFTEWNTLSPGEQSDKIKECWEEVEEGRMPLPSYVRMHPEARLSEMDRAFIRDWAGVVKGSGEDDDGGHDH